MDKLLAVIGMRAKSCNVNIRSANDVFNEKISDFGPEMELEDNSVLIFSSANDYYKFSFDDTGVYINGKINSTKLDNNTLREDDCKSIVYRNKNVRHISEHLIHCEYKILRLYF